ncbi:MAG: CerR family C-terminal domain-containing protein [Holophaga sp.]|nr:CerR family C-terminal domain-containing protein [Holophaga sp.]
MKDKGKSSPRGEQTRDALLDAAVLAFAREGFQSANLREIAEAAAVNPALIGYHFRSKEGLYLAVFERMIEQMRLVFDPLLGQIGQTLALPAPGAHADRVKRFLPPLLALVETMLEHMVDEHPAWGELIVREQHCPTAAYDLIYDVIISRCHGALVVLLQALRPGEEPERVRLLASAIASQVLIIRTSRAPMLRLLGWSGIGPRELAVMRALIRRNTTLLALGD